MPANAPAASMGPLLLDTCAVLWLVDGAPMNKQALAALEDAERKRQALFLSPISIWEIGLLMSKGRIASTLSPHAWTERLLAHPLMRLAELPPRVLIDASWLPGNPPADPADRMIIATARHYGQTILTRDRKILAYAEAGLVQALRC